VGRLTTRPHDLQHRIRSVDVEVLQAIPEHRVRGNAMGARPLRLAWATDIHLGFADDAIRRAFYESVRERADALVITGDLAESRSVGEFLPAMAVAAQRPIYFVLGNHDFYHGSIAETRSRVGRVVASAGNLTYLSQSGVVEITPGTALVGHDGWADARLGDFAGSGVILNDFLRIGELRRWKDANTLDKRALRPILEALGEEAARHLGHLLGPAAGKYPHVIVATHVPPFREAAWHQGRPSSDEWLPFFSCKAVGDVLVDAARAHPGCRILVLCGHTHGGGEIEVLENLHVLTGPAEYGKPMIQRIIEVE
jgi:3',5'-cyclic AMP phosphodiesterase CpdA